MITSKRVVANPSYRQRTGYHGMLVGGTALLVSAALVVANVHTKPAIELRQAEDVQMMLNEVIPAKLHDNDLLKDLYTINGKAVYQARLDGSVSAVAYQVAGPGYSGTITLIMAVDKQGKLLGVRVVSHSETPGLGDRIEEKRSSFVHEFEGKALTAQNEKQWGVKKDGGQFDQFSGATITPRAVVKAIKGGMQYFNDNRARLLTYEPGPDTQQEVK
jgi:electron transport complex protein RnfG